MNRHAVTVLILAVLLLTFSPACVLAAEQEPGGGVLDWLVGLVVPSEVFFETEYEKLDKKLSDKLPFRTYIDTVGRLKEISAVLDGDASALDISFEYEGEQQRIDIGSVLAPHLPKFRAIVTGLYVLFIAFYNYRQVMHLIRGTNYSNMENKYNQFEADMLR